MAKSTPEETNHAAAFSQAAVMEDVLVAFSNAANASLDQALEAMNSPTPQDRLVHLLSLQRRWNREILGPRLASIRRELRDRSIAQSSLLSQSPELWSRIATYLDETDLWNLERVTDPVYATCAPGQRPRWDAQWRFLDDIRHSKSSLRNGDPRIRGRQFARASQVAQRWERRASAAASSSGPMNDSVLQLTYDTNDQEGALLAYNRGDFVEDFGYYFQDPHQAGDPNVEFFLRLCYDDGKSNQPLVLLEGFQSNFISLRHTLDAQDTGYHTYIGAGGDRMQVVMVRNDLHLLKPYMNMDPHYSVLYSDDSELESDDEEEFHFLQWPEASRREFLDRLTITILRCTCGSTSGDKSGNHQLLDNNDKLNQWPRVVGSTRGYYESDEHFAIFRPLHLLPTTTSTTDQGSHGDAGRLGPPVVLIGLGCGGGDSLHIIIKWVQASYYY